VNVDFCDTVLQNISHSTSFLCLLALVLGLGSVSILWGQNSSGGKNVWETLIWALWIAFHLLHMIIFYMNSYMPMTLSNLRDFHKVHAFVVLFTGWDWLECDFSLYELAWFCMCDTLKGVRLVMFHLCIISWNIIVSNSGLVSCWFPSGTASCPSHFTPRERAPGTHWIGGWMGSRASLDAVIVIM
jgi:hypothetical protein